MKKLLIISILFLFSITLFCSPVRVVHNEDGSVSVIYPAPKSKKANETEVEWLKRVFDKATPEGAIYEDIDSSELPQSREHRNEWKLSEKKANGKRAVEIDQVKVNLKLQKAQEKQDKDNALRQKLGLSEEEFEMLKGKVR